MPELPEIETLRKSLLPKLVGRSIAAVTARVPRLRYPIQVEKLTRLAVGQKIISIERRSKYLIFNLESSSLLVVHLGMSGSLLVLAAAKPFDRHDHVIFTLDTGEHLRFRDPRRFGLVEALTRDELGVSRYFRKLGVEPLLEACTPAYFFERSRKVTKPIKNFLMDAQVVVGVGNIYANEALFRAGIHPTRAAGKLTAVEWKKLTQTVKAVLKKAIKKGGTTLRDFKDGDGEEGYFQGSLNVYGRKGEPCRKCGKAILRRVMAGRSTFYCTQCQT